MASSGGRFASVGNGLGNSSSCYTVAPMPVLLVPIEGNIEQAAGLLARPGIQSVVSFKPPRFATARVRAESAADAAERVSSALCEGNFALDRPELEPGE